MSPAGKPRVKAAIRLAQDIVRSIYERRMTPGQHYLSEAEALRHHGVARSTYREALRFLEFQGVMSVKAGPGGGPVITRPGSQDLASTIALLLQFADTPMSEVLEARTAIEPGMAEAAARHATDDEIAAMAADLDEMASNLGDYPAFITTYRRYWNHLAASTHNALLAFLSPALRSIVDSGGFVPDEVYRQATLERLGRIHSAVAAHDPDAARHAMRELELEFHHRLTSGYPRQMQRTVAWSDLDLLA